jgi:hypothetical protein
MNSPCESMQLEGMSLQSNQNVEAPTSNKFEFTKCIQTPFIVKSVVNFTVTQN